MITFEQLSTLIKARRSIFPAMYTDEKIDDKIILSILENATWAPNHKKTEPWRFIVFSNDALGKLGDYMAEAYKSKIEAGKFSELKFNKTRLKPRQSSHVIALCIQKDPMERVPEWEELAALSAGVQNMYLSCTALGLGCYWSTPSSMVGNNKFLQLGEGEKCYGLMYIGVTKEGVKLEGSREKLSHKMKWRRT